MEADRGGADRGAAVRGRTLAQLSEASRSPVEIVRQVLAEEVELGRVEVIDGTYRIAASARSELESLLTWLTRKEE
jgi:hypothetical protein